MFIYRKGGGRHQVARADFEHLLAFRTGTARTPAGLGSHSHGQSGQNGRKITYLRS